MESKSFNRFQHHHYHIIILYFIYLLLISLKLLVGYVILRYYFETFLFRMKWKN